MVYAYVHGITEFGGNEPSVQKSVFKRLRVEHCTYYIVVVHNFLSVPSVTHQCISSILIPCGYYIIVRQRVRGSTRFRNLRPVAMVSEHSEDTIPAGRGFLNRVDPIGQAVKLI